MEVKKGNKAVVDLALMQTFLIHYVNHVVLMLNIFFWPKFALENKEVCRCGYDGVIRYTFWAGLPVVRELFVRLLPHLLCKPSKQITKIPKDTFSSTAARLSCFSLRVAITASSSTCAAASLIKKMWYHHAIIFYELLIIKYKSTHNPQDFQRKHLCTKRCSSQPLRIYKMLCNHYRWSRRLTGSQQESRDCIKKENTLRYRNTWM